MKTIVIAAFLTVFGASLVQASVYENTCITFQEAREQSMSLPSTVSENELPELSAGWHWIMVYTPARDPELQTSHWMSWPDGETLRFCK